MVPIDVKGLELKVSDEERKVLHNLLDRMCDEGQVAMTWESFFPGKEPFTFERETMFLHMGIRKEKEIR